jgi:excisionase family DNA binding protein
MMGATQKRQTAQKEAPMSERFGLRIREAAEALGLGMTNTRKLVASGALPSVRIGKRIIITPESIRAFLANAAPTAGGGR